MSEGERRSLWSYYVLALVAGFANGALFMPDLTGYALSDTQSIGLGLLCAMPFLIGSVSSLLFDYRPVAVTNVLIAIYLAAAAPLLSEGFICIVMYAPIAIAVGTLAAVVTGWIVQKLRPGSARNTVAIFLWLMIPALGAKLDRVWLPKAADPVTIADAVDIRLSGLEIWRRIEITRFQFNEKDVPLAIRTFMPVPTAITGFGAHVGDSRLVDFHNGRVTATVTQSQFPRHFEFTLALESHGPEFFSHWVKFDKSSFDFAPVAPGVTRVTHTTTYVPRVFPRRYFQPVENYLSHRLQSYMLTAFFAPAVGTTELPGLAER